MEFPSRSGLHEPPCLAQASAVEITAAPVELELRHAFRIARPRRQPWRNVLVEVDGDGVRGLGEASPSLYYGETAEAVSALISAAAPWLRTLRIRTVTDVERAWADSWEHLAPSRAAQCAVDLALWDWLAKRDGVTVCELALGAAPRPVPTFCTIGLSTPEELPAKLAEVTGFPAIKVKSDADADFAPIRAARAEHDRVLAVDANCAWSAAALPRLCDELRELGVAFLEQPLPPEHAEQLPPKPRALPIFADESCVVETDLDHLSEHFDGCNIKLVKCGGLTPALCMARRAHDLGLGTMVGCMIETSALIAAGAVVAQITDYADLDGAWLLARDPVSGWRFERGILHPPQGISGLGIARVPDLR